MPDPARVTVVMTAYNREAYVGAAIESVLAQDFANFTLLVVDDASTDKTVAVVQRYAERDARVRLVVNERNRGDYPNRNHAARLVETPYFKFHDSDDVMYPHCLGTMMRLLEAEPRAGFALSGSRAWSGGPCPMLLTPRMAYQREFFGSGLFQYGPACALFRTEEFAALGGLPEEGVLSDTIFWMRACRTVHVLLVPGNLFWYREHLGQELRSARTTPDRLHAMREVWRGLSDPGCPLTEVERDGARTVWVRRNARHLMRHLRRGDLRGLTVHLLRCGITVTDWLRYLRRARTHPMAGTPVDDYGDYLVPPWPARDRGGS